MTGPVKVASGTTDLRAVGTAGSALLLPARTPLPPNPHRTIPVPTPPAHPTPRAIRVRRSPR